MCFYNFALAETAKRLPRTQRTKEVLGRNVSTGIGYRRGFVIRKGFVPACLTDLKLVQAARRRFCYNLRYSNRTSRGE